jgi:hypothetical protein
VFLGFSGLTPVKHVIVQLSSSGSIFVMMIFPAGSHHAGRVFSILWYGTFACKSRSAKSSPFSSPSSDVSNQIPTRWLDSARESCGGHFSDNEVDEVRSVMLSVPLLMTLVIFSVFATQVFNILNNILIKQLRNPNPNQRTLNQSID